jgi:hypothetical protein
VAHSTGTVLTPIGRIDAHSGLRLVDGQGHTVPNRFTSFDHFA